ncbi:trafficking protein particle complex subunit 11-like [Salvia splendens]|uniref:trafficking protein particle complex subunit 11-like n=1 Tax=Salvia splendens TaxID=180675 RepID=UPI001C26F844|nr:trafficking protein particle complex subunit 11-like [Salvia splendens]XP_042020190.1 trafficking protein particle complex subunit 11-like [Salvia splendens]
MEDFPEELRTPPVALSCLIGCPDVHPLITAHLHSQQPPINAIALPDFSKISMIPPKKPSRDPSEPPAGIIKRDWFSKHRTRIPAVVAAIFSSRDVSGDPVHWLQVCTDLDKLKASIRGRNIKLVVLVVTKWNDKDNTSEERILALRKRAEIDSKNLIIFVPDHEPELQQCLSRLWTVLGELANTYYRDEGRRVRSRLEKKNYTSMELHVRYCFKVAIYAEFRRDWLEALKLYEDAYHALREMVGTSTRMPPIQRLVEIKAVAEQLHFKMSTLLQHGGKVLEAITWFRQRTANYRKLVGAPEVIFLHWEWLSRQYMVFAQLLETSSPNALHVPSTDPVAEEKPTEWEFHPAYYYQLAASYLKEKNTCLEFALSMSIDVGAFDGSAESVVASAYLGQYSRLLEHEDAFITQPLTDMEYVHYALAEGKRFKDSFEIIALLKKSFEAYSSSKAERTAAYCGLQMAREYFSLNDFSNAKQIFDSVANLYRREGWLLSLWEVLGYLRECSKGTSSAKDFIEYSLEMASLPETTGSSESFSKDCGPAEPATSSQREKIHKEAFEVARGESELNSDEQNSAFKVKSDYPIYLEIDLISPLRVTLLALVAFHQPMVKPGGQSLITISLRSQLPINVEIDQLEVQFNQSECNFIITNGQKPQISSIDIVQPGHRVETAPDLVLATNKWLRLTYDIKSDLSGKLECIYVIARIGPNFTICCRAESPALMNDSPLWKFENRLETIPIKDPGLALSGQKAIQVEEPEPQVDLILDSSGPALVGESFILPVTVASRGHAVHSGELKINLVDTRGGGLLSPRGEESFSSDNIHVELVDISCDAPQDKSGAPSDKIQKIQPSFGLISVPSLDMGESWSCKLKIKWNHPKPIMLYVSLGYLPQSDDPSLQKVHVHKSLQIEGKIAVAISHRYMLPFRQDPLLLSKLKSVSETDQTPYLALNEKTLLIISVKNSSEVPLRLLSMSIETEEKSVACTVQPQQEEFREAIVNMPGEEFKKVFTIIPKVNSTKLKIGTVSLRWERDSNDTSSQVTKYRLPDVNVELPLLAVTVECPPHAFLGNPFLYSVKILNQTEMLQEIKCSISDSQSFVLSGPHSDTMLVLPRSAQVLTYMLVPLGLGSLQLPRVTVVSMRYSAGLQPSTASLLVFVYPTKPHVDLKPPGDA